VRTPLGEVVLARLEEAGDVEIAGPSAAADVRAVAERMLELGAGQVLIDGAIDRRAASSPAVADGLVMATGAILSDDIEQVVDQTRDAVELVRLPRTSIAPDALVTLPRRLALTAEPGEIAALLRERPDASAFAVDGALSERFPRRPARRAHRARGARPSDRRRRPDARVPLAPATALVCASGDRA